MRILHVSTRDSLGGAFRATNRVHQGLRQAGVDSQMLVARKYTEDPTVHLPSAKLPSRLLHGWRMWREKRPLNDYPNRIDFFSPAAVSADLRSALQRLNPDLVHLHWIVHGFVRPEDMSKWNLPLVWTMHDMWAFTGGCHYSGACTKYTDSCGACPQLASSQQHDLSRIVWQTKHKQWHALDFTVVSPSRWLADCARQSPLFHQKRIEVIPNGLDTELYHPISKEAVRAQLGLPQEAKIILFGAVASTTDKRKGYHLLLPALHRLANDGSLPNLHLVIVGADRSTAESMPPIPIHYAGYINDENELAKFYAAADLFVAPSLEDNLPNTVMEAIACGTPCVAFNIGGMPDMIEHQGNGYLAMPFDVDDLAKGMAWILGDDTRLAALAQRARAKATEEFSLNRVAEQHRGLYMQILEERVGKSGNPSGHG